jgi:hypothetical protein
MKRQTHQYTDEQVQFILECRLSRGLEYSRIAELFAEKWGGSRTSEQMRHSFRLHARPADASPPSSVDAQVSESHPLRDFTHAGFGSVRRVMPAGVKGRYFVTAASPVSTLSPMLRYGRDEFGANLYMPGFLAVQNWLRQVGGDLVLLPMRAHMPALRDQPSHYDPRLTKFRDCFASHVQFNEHLAAMDVHLNPQQVHPLTGMHRLPASGSVMIGERRIQHRRNQSIIIAHAQQDLESLATGNGTFPRLLCTTGAITQGEYLANRIGLLAQEAHVLGGLIVEVDDERFWIRQVQFAADGSFCDLGIRYSPDGLVAPVRAEAFRLGDLHAGREADLDTAQRLVELLQPKRMFVEDVVDGGAVNPHEAKNLLTKATAARPFTSLAEELTHARGVLHAIHGGLPDDCEFVVVDSNHDYFVRRWLETGAYTREPTNYEIGHRMVVEILDGRDPLRTRLDPDGEWTWLGSEDDYYVEGCQMAAHGHRGADGAKGSKSQLERVHGSAMVGHAHSAAVRGRLYVVGHSSQARHGYNRSASSWSVTRGVVYPGGAKQLMTTIDGRAYMDDAGGAGNG